MEDWCRTRVTWDGQKLALQTSGAATGVPLTISLQQLLTAANALSPLQGEPDGPDAWAGPHAPRKQAPQNLG
jgi:hypothetical protein